MTQTKRLSILGSTGSIGTQTLDIVRNRPEEFEVVALSANRNWKELARQANEWNVPYLAITNPEAYDRLKENLDYKPVFLGGDAADLVMLSTLDETDLLVNSLVGFCGFESTYGAIRAGKRVALANKESLVVGGELIFGLPGARELMVPVDSEHSAMLQCLVGEDAGHIRRILITASGGPFRTWSRDRMKQITPSDALKHPNWDMGSKITIDSSTMMNKGLEIIEAHWLFEIGFDKIVPVIHPQSVIHSVIEFVDGSSKAQLGPPDMKVPILYALSYPARIPYENPVLDYTNPFELTFEPVDEDRFPMVGIAVESGKKGGITPCVMNAANEIAVERFLKGEIHYLQIPQLVREATLAVQSRDALSVSLLLDADREARAFSRAYRPVKDPM